MNYLAHALPCLDDPYEVAGAAVPDWLGLTRPRLRCRSRHARLYIDDEDATLAAVARGVCRHHADDDWFHQTAAFHELSMELAQLVRHAAADAEGVRPSFLGHIMVELLLDATLGAKDPARMDLYYAALAAVDPRRVADAVAAMTGAAASPLVGIIERFVAMRFLYDYAADDTLTFRLNQVMRRVGLRDLPASFSAILPEARRRVAERRDALLAPCRGNSSHALQLAPR